MSEKYDQADIAGLLEDPPTGPEWEAWLAAHPEVAEELEITRRVRALMAVLRESSVSVPEGFEAELMARVRADRTLLDLLDLALSGVGHILLEMISALLAMVPSPQAG